MTTDALPWRWAREPVCRGSGLPPGPWATAASDAGPPGHDATHAGGAVRRVGALHLGGGRRHRQRLDPAAAGAGGGAAYRSAGAAGGGNRASAAPGPARPRLPQPHRADWPARRREIHARPPFGTAFGRAVPRTRP